MFLSDILEEIYNKTNCFDGETCYNIKRAIILKLKEELDGLFDQASTKEYISSSVLYRTIDNARNVFNKFINKHKGEYPEMFYNDVIAGINSIKKVIDNAVKNSK